MARKIVTMFVVAGILLAFEWCGRATINRMTGEALDQTQRIMQMIRARRFIEAKRETHALDEAWDERANMLELMIDHSTSDDVRFALSRLIAALECEEMALAMVYASELEGSLEHVLERQAITLQNLL